ncbi:MAG: VCBS repeat-containing protein [Gammaproteobacteria bacterium]|nr:VCBS repeat-containing protein [Gammaproteobacteria bacterium]
MSISIDSVLARISALLAMAAFLPTVHADQNESTSIESLSGYTASKFSIPADVRHIHMIDLNADSRKDLILEFRDELRVVHQGSDGFELQRPQSIPIPQKQAMWDVARLDSSAEVFSIVVLDSDSNLRIWKPSGGLYREDVVNVPIPSIHLPDDAARLRFCIDINEDSIDDLALPTTHFVYVIEMSDDNQLLRTSKIPLLSSSSSSLSADTVSDRVGQTYTGSSASFYDINNDSHMDVVLQNDSAVRIALGNALESSYFSSTPDYDINFEKDTRKIDFDSIDFSNLFSLIRFAPNRVQIKDVNSDALMDLIILEPNRVLVYVADENGIDTTRPTQVMRFNENTIVADLYDINGDGTSDLVAVKTPYDVSVRRVLLTLVVPTTLRFELLVFNNADGKYSRRPDSRLLVNMKVPAILPTILTSGGIVRSQDKLEASINLDLLGSETKPPLPILDAQLDELGPREVIAIQSGEVRVFFNVVSNDSVLTEAGQFDELRELRKILDSGEEVTIDVGKLITSEIDAVTHLDLIEDVESVVVHQLAAEPTFHDLLRLQLNDDSLDDIVIFEDRTSEAITGLMLISDMP